MGHLPYAGDGFPRMADDWRRKAPRKKGNTGKKKGKGNKGADRWASGAAREKGLAGACGRLTAWVQERSEGEGKSACGWRR